MLLKFDYFYFTKECFKASDCRISSVRPDISEFRISFQTELDFQKIKKNHYFAIYYLRLIFHNLKDTRLKPAIAGCVPSILIVSSF